LIAIEKARAASSALTGEQRNSSRSRCARDGHRFESPQLHQEVRANRRDFLVRRMARHFRAIVENLIALVEEQRVEFVAALFRSIWGAEPGRLRYVNRPSFFGEILCCWRPRWIPGSEGSPMHAYAWYIWRNTPRNGPSLKARVGKSETITALSAVKPPMRG
jgi:hypothetical protein